jgi:hypothetical protein
MFEFFLNATLKRNLADYPIRFMTGSFESTEFDTEKEFTAELLSAIRVPKSEIFLSWARPN